MANHGRGLYEEEFLALESEYYQPDCCDSIDNQVCLSKFNQCLA